jgi:hypothetical protein
MFHVLSYLLAFPNGAPSGENIVCNWHVHPECLHHVLNASAGMLTNTAVILTFQIILLNRKWSGILFVA